MKKKDTWDKSQWLNDFLARKVSFLNFQNKIGHLFAEIIVEHAIGLLMVLRNYDL